MATLLIFWDPKITISWYFSDACRLWVCGICDAIFINISLNMVLVLHSFKSNIMVLFLFFFKSGFSSNIDDSKVDQLLDALDELASKSFGEAKEKRVRVC